MIKNAFWLFIISIFVLVVFIPSYTRMQDLEQKVGEYENEIHRLQKETLALQKERWQLEEDPVYLEKVAREKMGLIKEGEVVYRITPLKTNQELVKEE